MMQNTFLIINFLLLILNINSATTRICGVTEITNASKY